MLPPRRIIGGEIVSAGGFGPRQGKTDGPIPFIRLLLLPCRPPEGEPFFEVASNEATRAVPMEHFDGAPEVTARTEEIGVARPYPGR